MRHKDAFLCTYGAFTFYLMLRFNRTKEKIDFSNKKNWFNTKLLVDVKQKNFSTAMKGVSYANNITQACVACGLEPNKQKHFGRAVGHAV